ncbi:MAG: hypothetical protein AB7I68_11250 [Porticoccaceae bacterium]
MRRQRPAQQLPRIGAGVLAVAHQHLAVDHGGRDAGGFLHQAARTSGQVVARVIDMLSEEQPPQIC